MTFMKLFTVMKLFTIMLFAVFFLSCSTVQQPNKPAAADSEKIEKNKQIAVLNEVGEITRAAQSLEHLGRDMNSYRLAPDAESRRTCSKLTEDRRLEIADLETKIKKLPAEYGDRLTSILPDLTDCVACSPKAMNGCVKARASINKTIKETFPQQ